MMSVNSTVAGTRFFGLYIAGEDVEPGVGHLGDADVDVALAAGRLFGAGHQLEQGRLAAGGETDQSRTKHEFFSLARGVRPRVVAGHGSDPNGR